MHYCQQIFEALIYSKKIHHSPLSTHRINRRAFKQKLKDRFSYSNRYQLTLSVILAILCFVTFAPFFWVVLTSIKPNKEIYTTHLQVFPQEPTLEHYRTVFEKRESLPTYIINTLIYSGVTIAIVSTFASMAGYALGALKIKGAEIFSSGVLIILSVRCCYLSLTRGYMIPVWD